MIELFHSATRTVIHYAGGISRQGILGDLVPNVWVGVAHALAAISVISIIVFLIWKPTRAMLQKQREFLDQKIHKIEEEAKLSESYLKQANDEKAKAQQIAHEIVYNAQKEVEVLKNDAEETASKQANEIFQKALLDAEQVKKDASSSVKQNVTDIAFNIAEKIISTNLKTETNQKIVDEYLNNLEK